MIAMAAVAQILGIRLRQGCGGTSNTGTLDIFRQREPYYDMSKVEQIESELRKLSSAELRQVRDWLDDFVEDQMEFTPEFEAAIRQSESEMKSGARPQVRRP
jgi:hypothetical protein